MIHLEDLIDYEESFQEIIINSISITHKNVEEIESWCKENNVDAVFVGTKYDKYIWFVKGHDSRVLFTLRWV